MIRKFLLSFSRDIWAVITFLAVVVAFFSPTILWGKLPVPADALVGLYHPWRDFYSSQYPRGIPFKNFLVTDPVRQQIPWRKIVTDQWKQGKIPLWNPYNFSGAPILANIQAAALYPLNILFLIFPFIDAWTMLIISQTFLAGLFLYWYLRSLRLGPIAGLLGAIAWSFSGFNVAWLTWGTIGHVALWLPLALLSVDKLFQTYLTTTRKIVWSIIFILSLVFQFFAGHTQISLYFILTVVGYGAIRIMQAKDRKKVMLMFIVLLSLVALFTAVQWIPLLDWVRQSGRVLDVTDWHKEGWFIPWAHLVQFVAPDFFGNPTTLNYWGQWNYGEFVGYVGILPLVFAFIAIVSGTLKAHRVWIGVASVALLFALPTPISILPFILKFSILSSLQPTRLLFVIDFAFVMLAAYGCEEFFENSKQRRWMWSIGILGMAFMVLWGIVAASRFGLLDRALQGFFTVSMRNLLLPTFLFAVGVVVLSTYRRFTHRVWFRNVLKLGLIGLVSIDVLRFGWKFTPFTDRTYFFPETKVISFLKNQKQPARMMSLDKRILPPNTASYFGIESIEGYDPIISSRYEELMAAVARGKPDIMPPFGFNRIVSIERLDMRLLGLFGVRYILSLQQLVQPGLREVLTEGDTRVYEIVEFVPRAYLAERYLERQQKQTIINALFDPMFKPGKHAVIEVPIRALQSTPLVPTDYVRLISYSTSSIELSVQISQIPRLVVVQNSYNAGWRATIDGKTTEIYRTNYAFQGIVVPEGTHTVVFSYSL